MPLTKQLKAKLWRQYGCQETPAEWDGQVYGGGKLSQRFWEYFKVIELLELDENSVIVDIGGGSPATGLGFFGALLASAVKRVIVFDPNIAPNALEPENVEFVRKDASYEELSAFLAHRPEITHISCISVFEHIEPAVREGVVRAINEHFKGVAFVATYEFHPKKTYFESQLTAKTASDLFKPLTRFYLDEYCSSPAWSEDAFDNQMLFKLSRKTLLSRANIPLWHPIAVRFLRLTP